MELSKVSLLAIFSLTLFSSCATRNPEMTQADQILFEQTLKTSNSENTGQEDLSYYTVLPRDLKEALTSYNEMYRFGGMHDYDYLQELGIRFLEESRADYDPEAQLLSIYGASIAKTTSFFLF